MNTSPTTPLAVIEAALAPHVLDLLDTAGIAGSVSPAADRADLVSIAVAATQVERARATLEEGLLTVTLPRQRERRGGETHIPIERGRDE